VARIILVYNTERRAAELLDMSYIRWFKIGEALARLGHQVDLATAEFKWRLRRPVITMGPRLRRVPLSSVRWDEYDVVKTLFHQGFDTLVRYGGHRHRFIISKLGSVVGPRDMPGIYFYGRRRARLFRTQTRIDQTSRYVTLLTEPARDLWTECFGSRGNLLLVPGAAERPIMPSGVDPYPTDSGPRLLFAGNLYRARTQPEANRVLVDKLNALGRLVGVHGARLFVLGPGDVRRLDRRYVTYLGAVHYRDSWDYLHFAHVGILVAAGPFMHNNESTKIYHYLRAGLPVVSEAGFPNDDVLRRSGLAFVVDNGDLETMAARAVESVTATWDREAAVRFILEHHTWDQRAAIYDRVIARELDTDSGAEGHL
jgi:hypothetical protein